MGTGWYRWQGDVLILQVHVQPRASRDEIVGPHGDALKIRITAPPVEGRANRQLTALLAKTFGVAKGAVELAGGDSGRRKRFRIHHPRRLLDGMTSPKK